MAKLNGGEFLLDLTPIEVEESVDTETYTSITNVDVLKQLTNLKRYIVNPSAIKPVWVKFVNSETDEIVVVKGELSKFIDLDEFDIHVKTKGYDLTIHVEFTQALNEDSDLIDDWYIDTNDAKYLFISNVVSGGTKLYRHYFYDEDNEYYFTVITNDKTPFDLSSLTYLQLRALLQNLNAEGFIINFTNLSFYTNLQFNDELMYYLYVDSDNRVQYQPIDDIIISSLTDTVTPL